MTMTCKQLLNSFGCTTSSSISFETLAATQTLAAALRAMMSGPTVDAVTESLLGDLASDGHAMPMQSSVAPFGLVPAPSLFPAILEKNMKYWQMPRSRQS